jgi:hypothetical protein
MIRRGNTFAGGTVRRAAAAVAGLLLLGSALLVGCASRGRQSIASGARLVKSGTGTVEYTAKSTGTIYVLDADDNRLMGLGGVKPGQTVHLDAEKGDVLIDQKVINERPINGRHHYQVYFKSDE